MLRKNPLIPAWPERESKYSPQSSAEVKNTWSYTSSPLYVFIAWKLIN
jgi:hypothetical protein